MPNETNGNDRVYGDGYLTIRELFAVTAMGSFITTMANIDMAKAVERVATAKGLTMEAYVAYQSCVQADALIAELNKEQGV